MTVVDLKTGLSYLHVCGTIQRTLSCLLNGLRQTSGKAGHKSCVVGR